jgi:NADPH:quinone reductase-like Zn-dependent oxidoreductase
MKGKPFSKNSRFYLGDAQAMKAVITHGNGGYEQLDYRDVPIPKISPGEVLLQVLAAAVNNTEINTRLGWYSSQVSAGTEDLRAAEMEKAKIQADGGWNQATPFPFIQGTDCCGKVISTLPEENTHILGKRALVRPCIRPQGFTSMENIWMASDFDGAFAQFVKIDASEVFPVNCDWSDTELGSIPCAYGSAENMLHRAEVTQGEQVLITGASGGVGSAAVQLAKRRKAIVTAITGKSKIDKVRSIGADRVIPRGDDLPTVLGEEEIDVVVDNVAGPGFSGMLKVLKRGGRYVSSGAIAGPLVNLDMRDFYLKDITLIGCTAWDEPVFPNLISYIEKGEIRPLVAKTYPLEQIVEAQREFTKKEHVGKFVLIPPPLDERQKSLFSVFLK